MEIQNPVAEEQMHSKNRICVRSFEQIQIQPTPINHAFYCQEEHNLYLSREKSSEVYHVSFSEANEINFQHIARLPWSRHILKINGILMLFCPFELRVWLDGKWILQSFTTELLSLHRIDNALYSFHQEETIEWILDEDDFRMNQVKKNKIPFHLNKNGELEGFGKKVVPPKTGNESAIFSCCQWKSKDYVAAGDDAGRLVIYDYTTLGHLKTIHRHMGPILAIKIDPDTDTIFFSGSDSKVSCVRRIDDQWIFGGQIRGQSHDIYALELIGNKTLISGGVTTDICCYSLYSGNEVFSSYENKVSFSSEALVSSMDKLLLVNKITSFQIWKTNEQQEDLQLLVRYQMPAQKFIKSCKISKKMNDGTHLVIASSEIDTVGWKFDSRQGLSKVLTIKNSYHFIEFLPSKDVFVGFRDTGDIEKVFCSTGKILQILNIDLWLPTQMKLLADERLMIASNLCSQIKVIDLKRKSIVFSQKLKSVYEVVCEKNQKELLLKYCQDRNIYALPLSNKFGAEQILTELPANNIRFSGVLVHRSQVSKVIKKYWYFVAENRIYLCNNLNNKSKKTNIRSIYTNRIGCALKPRLSKNWELGIVTLNFKRMIENSEIQPLIAKKIQ